MASIIASSPGHNAESLTINEIIKEGYLFVKRPPGKRWNRFKAWQKKFLFLQRTGKGYFLSISSNNQDVKKCYAKPCLSALIDGVVHLGLSTESHRFSKVIVIVLGGKAPILLASEDEVITRSWLKALETANSEERKLLFHSESSQFPLTRTVSTSTPSFRSSSQTDNSISESKQSVEIAIRDSNQPFLGTNGFDSRGSSTRKSGQLHHQMDHMTNVGRVLSDFIISLVSTEASENVGLRGCLHLRTYLLHLGIGDETDSKVIWPVWSIRQYRLDSSFKRSSSWSSTIKPFPSEDKRRRPSLVTIEVGRRCPTGEGTFRFTTLDGEEIIRQIKKSVAHLTTLKSGPSVTHNSLKSSLSIPMRRHEEETDQRSHSNSINIIDDEDEGYINCEFLTE